MPIYPIPARATSYRPGTMGSFGAARATPPGRLHGACDLYAPAGTPIYSCEDGTVTLGPYLFYDGSFAIEITAADGRVFRYCEMQPVPGMKVGDKVKAGDVVGTVKLLPSVGMSMLHFEMFSGQAQGMLTQFNPKGAVMVAGKPVPLTRFARRADLLNPTEYLDKCEIKK